MAWVVRIPVSTLLLLIGCGGATALGPDESPTAQDAENYCDARCNRTGRCNGSPPAPDCRTSCVEDLGQSTQHARRDFVRHLTSCIAQLPCDDSIDTCRESAAEAIGAGPADIAASPEVRECLERQSVCGTFKDDTCNALLLLVSSSRKAALSCLEQDCAAISACLDPIFGN